jgi:hypothetical protein
MIVNCDIICSTFVTQTSICIILYISNKPLDKLDTLENTRHFKIRNKFFKAFVSFVDID